MQAKPTQRQVMNAFAVIENADDADAMALMVSACQAAWKWRVLDEVCVNLKDEDREAFDACFSAFDTHY